VRKDLAVQQSFRRPLALETEAGLPSGSFRPQAQTGGNLTVGASVDGFDYSFESTAREQKRRPAKFTLNFASLCFSGAARGFF
jgi:hypothetical protein